MSEGPIHSYHAVAPHPQRPEVLAVKRGDGWQLPGLETPEFIDWNVADWNAAMSEAAGIKLGTLRRLRADYNRETKVEQGVFLMETLSPSESVSAGARWVNPMAVALTPFVQSALELWLAEVKAGQTPEDRSAWTRPGWHAETAAWLGGELQRLGFRLTGEATQRRQWAITSIISQPTDQGLIFAKHTHPLFTPEARVVEKLASHYPNHLPAVALADSDRGALVMRDFDAGLLYDSPRLEDWEAALRTHARIQQDNAARVQEFLDMGCWDRRPDKLAELIDPLLADTGPMNMGQPRGITPPELERLRGLAARLKELCRALADSPIPVSLNNGDFHAKNIAIKDGNPLFFDWSDAQITHPFFDLMALFEDMPGELAGAPNLRQHVTEAYLDEWKSFGSPEGLRGAFALARPLAMANLAVSYQRIYNHVEPAARQELIGGQAIWLRQLLAWSEESSAQS